MLELSQPSRLKIFAPFESACIFYESINLMPKSFYPRVPERSLHNARAQQRIISCFSRTWIDLYFGFLAFFCEREKHSPESSSFSRIEKKCYDSSNWLCERNLCSFKYHSRQQHNWKVAPSQMKPPIAKHFSLWNFIAYSKISIMLFVLKNVSQRLLLDFQRWSCFTSAKSFSSKSFVPQLRWRNF